MKAFLKFLPKLVFDQDVKFIVGLLMLIAKSIADVNAGKMSESKALKAVVEKVYTKLLPPNLKETATELEIIKVIESAQTLFKDVKALFSK